MQSQRCRGTVKKTGKQCQRLVIGSPVCIMHGQNRRTKEKRLRLIAEDAAVQAFRRWGVPVEVSGTEAIVEQIHLWAGIERFYRFQVDSLSKENMMWGMSKSTTGVNPSDTYEAKPHLWIVLHEMASNNLVRFAAEAIKAGLEERRVRLAEKQGALVAEALQRIFGDLDLSDAQWTKVGDIVPRHLRMLSAS
jgi:hypothetical protein